MALAPENGGILFVLTVTAVKLQCRDTYSYTTVTTESTVPSVKSNHANGHTWDNESLLCSKNLTRVNLCIRPNKSCGIFHKLSSKMPQYLVIFTILNCISNG